MSREEIHKLLGGYATDTLSEAERRALLEAALEDQELFDALAKEQALREALQEPGARRQLLEALEPAHDRWQWLRRPAVLALAGSAAVLLIVAGLVLRPAKPPGKPVLIAKALQETAPPAPMVKVVPPAPAAAAAPAPSSRPPRPRRAAKMAQPLAKPMESAPAAIPPPPAAAAELAPVSSRLALPYTVLLQGADGQYAPAPRDMIFHPGDAVRIRLEPAESGYLHLYRRDASGAWQTVSTQPVTRGQAVVAPADGALEYQEPGRKELLAVVSPQREANPAQPEGLAGRPQAAAGTGAFSRADLVRQNAAPRSVIRITLEYR
jgi:hypothetical protein